jgi:transcriptional regulator with XRE-family HTH domain
MAKSKGIPSSLDDDMLRSKYYEIMKALEVSQREYAALCGFNHSNLSRFLKGKKPPTKPMLDALNMKAVTYYEYK